jgi:hypothetical protein
MWAEENFCRPTDIVYELHSNLWSDQEQSVSSEVSDVKFTAVTNHFPSITVGEGEAKTWMVT